MRRYTQEEDKSKQLFVGIDLHRLRWLITIRTEEVELFSGSIPGRWEALEQLLDRYRRYRLQAVYEAAVTKRFCSGDRNNTRERCQELYENFVVNSIVELGRAHAAFQQFAWTISSFSSFCTSLSGRM